MNFTPRRTLGFALGLLFLALLVAAIAVSIAQLGRGLISPLSLVWIGLLLLALPLVLLVINRLYGLVTARYRVDRDGLYVRWGMSYEQIPLDLISEVSPPRESDAASEEIHEDRGSASGGQDAWLAGRREVRLTSSPPANHCWWSVRPPAAQ